MIITIKMIDALVLAESGDSEGLKKLVVDGFDITTCKGLNGYTPLHHACNRGHANIVFDLLKLRAPVDAVNDAGETALHLAVYAGNILIVDQLLDMGADVNYRNAEGETPLLYAARKSMPAIIRLLLQRGADPNLPDKYSDYPIDHVSNKSTENAFKHHNQVIQGDSATTATTTRSAFHYHNLLLIFSFLQIDDILKCACVCTKWHRVTEDESIWKQLGVKRYSFTFIYSI